MQASVLEYPKGVGYKGHLQKIPVFLPLSIVRMWLASSPDTDVCIGHRSMVENQTCVLMPIHAYILRHESWKLKKKIMLLRCHPLKTCVKPYWNNETKDTGLQASAISFTPTPQSAFEPTPSLQAFFMATPELILNVWLLASLSSTR